MVELHGRVDERFSDGQGRAGCRMQATGWKGANGLKRSLDPSSLTHYLTVKHDDSSQRRHR